MSGRRLAFAVVTLMLVSCGASVASGAGLPTALTQLRPAFQVRPDEIVYTGDGTGLLGGRRSGPRDFGHIAWSSWGGREAHGHGRVWLDDCEPDCADGSYFSRAVTIRLFDPEHGKFHRLTIRYRLHRRPVVDRRYIRHVRGSDGLPGYWEYQIASISRARSSRLLRPNRR